MKIDEWAVQDAVDSGDFSRILPILIEHYGVGRIPDWAGAENEHALDCAICTVLRPWLQAAMDSISGSSA
jgi:hypothetical protein